MLDTFSRARGVIRTLHSWWHPQRYRIEQLERSATDAPLYAWLTDLQQHGTRYISSWKSLESRIITMVQSQPDRIDGPLAEQYLGCDGCSFDEISVTLRGGRFLSSVAANFCSRNVVEIGTAFGVSGMFLLSGMSDGYLWTFDPCEDWRGIAEDNLRAVSRSFSRIGETFEDGFPKLASTVGPIDLAFVDGLHTREHVLREWNMLVPHMRTGGLILFHDVAMDDGMRDAWGQIKSHETTICSAFVENQFGVIQFSPASGLRD